MHSLLQAQNVSLLGFKVTNLRQAINEWLTRSRLGDLVGLDIPTRRRFQLDGDYPPEHGCTQ